jgi:tripartite-type tricarboxylate transporter receptor subunit TctC
MACRTRLKSFVAAALLGSAMLAQAAFPEKPIRLFVPFPAGGTTDVVARHLVPKVSEILGQPLVIVNRGGAGGSIATGVVAESPADGYTLLMATNSHTANPSIYKRLPFDTAKDFASVALVADSPGLFVIHPSIPANNLKEFVALAKKANPPLTYGTAGAGTYPHLAAELFKAQAGIEMTHIPYKGAAPALVDLLAGVYALKVEGIATGLPQVKAGKLKALAVTSRERVQLAPDIPTVAEQGYPDYEANFWMAILVPAGTPKDVIARLEQAFITTAKDAEVAAKLQAIGQRVLGKPAPAVDELIARELKQWPPIVKKAGISVE